LGVVELHRQCSDRVQTLHTSRACECGIHERAGAFRAIYRQTLGTAAADQYRADQKQ
jgi:hypothetical protein